MKSIIEDLDKAFNNKIRMGIMAVLVVNDWVDFNTLKTLIKATDGNLSSHLTGLEKVTYILVKKEFVGKKPRTSYKVSEKGKTAFENHLNALENLLKNAQIK